MLAGVIVLEVVLGVLGISKRVGGAATVGNNIVYGYMVVT